MNRRSAPILLLLPLLAFPAAADAQYTKDWNPWPVVMDGDTVPAPFWGGINFPKVSLIDFDGDGLLDLMVGDVSGKLSYLRNTGTAEEAEWTPQVERLGGVDIGTWHTFCDIDGDGDYDLFCDGKNGQTAFYRNMSSGDTIDLKFETSAFGGFETGFNNTCAFADIDGDGDFDFFFGGATGELTFYRNNGDSANPSFVWVTNSYDSVLAFPGGLSASGEHHGFSALHFSDFDLDGDFDLFYGDIFNFNVYLFENHGTPTVSDLTKVSEAYLPMTTFGFNHIATGDLDNDGDIDMVVGVGSQDYNNLYFLRNDGGTYVVADSNIIKTIDRASYGVPTFGDLDGDGDLDMLLGGVDGRLWHFENVGTPTEPTFVLQSRFYKGIDVGLTAAPVLVDWDCDGDLDLLIGNDAGRIQFWRNIGSPSNFNPVLVTNQLAGIIVDQLAMPVPVDLNGDGLRDLLVGEWDFNGLANILLYQNTGNNPDPTLSLVTTRLLKRTPRDITLPTVIDWDGDGKKDLIVGGRYSGSVWYRNTAPPGQFPDSLTLIAQPDTLPWADDGYRLVVRFADIDGDGDLDAFVGEEDGGVNLYQRDGSGTPCACPSQGDIDASGVINATDLTLMINIIFFGGLNVQDSNCPRSRANFNGDGVVNATDLTLIINHIFFGGAGPVNPCALDGECP